ncbi:anionic trypsin-2-like isoform X13 [Epinephelus fuscoguttatus]|uniref:anionic trypsin-2-like isoform X11 n=1 Tax=Epinephelus fuscoguttatus TaxID=293821 RepID=UPI0020D17EAD|nr:anionic trypsin-2-like isoform X11 [Epinephelus fuscoguttatus]XP_049426923.1 anionic trypsin-2-like isoform X12 [Epinephelus fuscoguttatus]XP_049426924.1 anionic trypsin-2-like isoform X13 [Epinephelus fuscoguttatus]
MGGITRLLLLLWAGVTVSTVVDLQKRIIGGQDCGQKERRYHVKLRITNGTHEMLCGGSLISDRWILTAAHCQEPGWKIYATLGVHPGPGTEVEIKSAPVVFKDSSNRIHDIMLLKLPERTDIKPVPLPDCNNRPKIGDTVQIAGHGATTTGPNNERLIVESATLLCLNTEVVDCQGLRECVKKRDPQSSRRYQHWFSCYRQGVESNRGDSGGGVVYNGMIYGVISFGVKLAPACVDTDGYMDVCAYKDWIESKTGSIFTKIAKALSCVGCPKL